MANVWQTTIPMTTSRLNQALSLLLITWAMTASAQAIATLEVQVDPNSTVDAPLSISLDEITSIPDSVLVLQEITGSKKTPIPYQISNLAGRRLHWIVQPGTKQKKRTFELSRGVNAGSTAMMAAAADGGLLLKSGSTNLLRYQVELVYPPAGVDSAYRRNGFIHPLWSPHGQELTRIQPKDHYHHYGIWNPWTHVLYKGDTVDFWNIGGKKGTVRFAGLLSTASGPVFSGFIAKHEHIVTKKGVAPEVAMNEVFAVGTWRPSNDYYYVDIVSRISCATDAPVVLLEYRYGGLGWRATGEWDNKNSEVLTSEGKVRKESDGSKARWCIIQGTLGSDYGGAVMMSHPTNYNHPEPLRIWPENQYNRGDMFANFSPTKDRDWKLEPGKSYLLRYRLVVFNGKMTKEKAEEAWKNFASEPVVTVKLN
jgi:hypothetical protein